jgi:hypothetical protein
MINIWASAFASLNNHYVTVRLPFVNENASRSSRTSCILQQCVIIDATRTILDRRTEGRCSWLSR